MNDARHPFDRAVTLTATGPGLWRGETSAAYANLVGPFGGITAAVLLQAVLDDPSCQGDPVALTVNFAGPVAEGPYDLSARPSRTNRSTQHWNMQLAQGEDVHATATAVLAQRRSSWTTTEAAPPAVERTAERAERLPAHGFPPWVARYDMRFLSGNVLDAFGAGQADSESRLWLRDDPPRPLSYASLAALSDAFLPRIFLRLGKPVPIGTVTLTTYFHASPAQLAAQAERHLLGCARGVNFRDGYFDQAAQLWSDAGDLLATSHQLVYYRDGTGPASAAR